MTFKILGTKNAEARIIIIKESDWSIEHDAIVSGTGVYEITELGSGAKTIVAETDSGEVIGYGNVTPYEFTGDRGVFAGGYATTTIDYVTLSTPGNAQDFGDLTASSIFPAACSNGTNNRGLVNLGQSLDNADITDYITINSLGNSTFFGNLTYERKALSSTSNGTHERGLFAGGEDSHNSVDQNIIDYFTINSTSDATDFGNLTQTKTTPVGCSNATNERGLFGGGAVNGAVTARIDYVTINSTSNASIFGNLSLDRQLHGGCSNGTNERGVWGGGTTGTTSNRIDYVAINSLGDAADFGDLTVARYNVGGTSNGTDEQGVFMGGRVSTTSQDVIDYITISSTGNATDFGDLTEARYYVGATSNA